MTDFEIAVDVATDVDTTWSRVGDFANLAPVLPPEATVTIEGEGIGQRRLVVMPPAPIPTIEELVELGDRHYTYVMIKALLPVKDFRSTFRAEPLDGGARIIWSGAYDTPFGVPGAAVKPWVLKAYYPALMAFAALAEGRTPQT